MKWLGMAGVVNKANLILCWAIPFVKVAMTYVNVCTSPDQLSSDKKKD